jgi:hypothetical protein
MSVGAELSESSNTRHPRRHAASPAIPERGWGGCGSVITIAGSSNLERSGRAKAESPAKIGIDPGYAETILPP